jgi:hypothetical protein
MTSLLTEMAKNLKHFLAKHTKYAKESKKILPDYVQFSWRSWRSLRETFFGSGYAGLGVCTNATLCSTIPRLY